MKQLTYVSLPFGSARTPAPTSSTPGECNSPTAQASCNGAGMTETNSNTVGKPQRDGDGLFASAQNGLVKTVRGRITARWRADGHLREPKTVLKELGDRIE